GRRLLDVRRTPLSTLLARGLRHERHREQRHAENHHEDRADDDRAAAAWPAVRGRCGCGGNGRRPRRRWFRAVPLVVTRECLLRRLPEGMAVRADEASRKDGRRQRREVLGFQRFQIAQRYAGHSGDLLEREPAALTKLTEIIADGSHTAKRV